MEKGVIMRKLKEKIAAIEEADWAHFIQKMTCSVSVIRVRI